MKSRPVEKVVCSAMSPGDAMWAAMLSCDQRSNELIVDLGTSKGEPLSSIEHTWEKSQGASPNLNPYIAIPD